VEGFVHGLYHVVECGVVKSGRSFTKVSEEPVASVLYSEDGDQITRRHMTLYSNLRYVSRT
jgi:hypothetical protein